jgi:hypothetical protein
MMTLLLTLAFLSPASFASEPAKRTQPTSAYQARLLRETAWMKSDFAPSLGDQPPLGKRPSGAPGVRFAYYMRTFDQAIQTGKIGTETGIVLAMLHITTALKDDYKKLEPAPKPPPLMIAQFAELVIFSCEKMLDLRDRLKLTPFQASDKTSDDYLEELLLRVFVYKTNKGVIDGSIQKATTFLADAAKAAPSLSLAPLRARLDKVVVRARNDADSVALIKEGDAVQCKRGKQKFCTGEDSLGKAGSPPPQVRTGGQ